MATAKTKTTARVCQNGHRFIKSSACPVCPVCERSRNTTVFTGVAAPARRALAAANITTYAQLATFSEQHVLNLHGMGPRAVAQLRDALQAMGMSFSQPEKSGKKE